MNAEQNKFCVDQIRNWLIGGAKIHADKNAIKSDCVLKPMPDGSVNGGLVVVFKQKKK